MSLYASYHGSSRNKIKIAWAEYFLSLPTLLRKPENSIYFTSVQVNRYNVVESTPVLTHTDLFALSFKNLVPCLPQLTIIDTRSHQTTKICQYSIKAQRCSIFSLQKLHCRCCFRIYDAGLCHISIPKHYARRLSHLGIATLLNNTINNKLLTGAIQDWYLPEWPHL